MKRLALLTVAILFISAIPMAGGDTLFTFVEGNGTDASQFGFNVTYLGDINGDGYDDVAVGAPYNDSADGGRSDCGAVYIFFGYANMDSFHGNNIDMNNANVTIYGANPGDHFGWSLSSAGDVNGDGYNDTIVGAPDALTGTTEKNGSAYVFYGKTTASWPSIWDLSTVAADVTLTGESNGDKFGASVSGGGKVNDDVFDEVVVGAPYNDTSDGSVSNAGAVYIYYGGSPMDTVADVSLYGNKTNGYYGFSVSSAGDVNSDSKDDVIIGEPANDMAYIYYGQKLSEDYGIVDAPQNESIVEGTGSGGSYIDTQTNNNIYRNITENLTTTSGQSSFTDNSADDFNDPAPILHQTRVLWYGAVGLDWSARTWALNESFDTMADGDPAGWVTTDGDVAGDDVAVQSTVFHETNGTTVGKSVKFDDAQTADYERTIIGVSTSGTVIVEGWLMQESGGTGGGLRMVGYELISTTLYYLYIVGFSDGYIKYYSGTTEYSTGVAVTNNQWYHIYIVWYTATATYDVYVDGVLKVSGASSVSGQDVIEYAGFRTYPNAGTTVAYGDDIRIYDANTFYSSGYFVSGITTTPGNIQSVKGEWYNETYGQSLQIRVSRDGGTTWSPVLQENQWYGFTNGEPAGNQLCYNLSFSTSLIDRVTPLLYNITLRCNWTTTAESLDVRYLIDGFDTSHDYYEVQFSASAFNTTTNSLENFTIQYKVDSGPWDDLGVGYIISGGGEQYLSELTYAKPNKNITVKIIDNTTNSVPQNTIHIDLIRVRCYSDIIPIKLVGDLNTNFGRSVAGIGNVNNGGTPDVAVSAPGTSNGNVYAWLDGDFKGTGSIINKTDVEFNAGSPTKINTVVMPTNPVEDGHVNLTGNDVFHDGFEGATSPGDKWTLDQGTGSITQSNLQQIYGSYSCRLYDTDTADSVQMHVTGGVTYPTKGIIGAYFYIDSGTNGDGLTLLVVGSGYFVMAVSFYNGYIYYRDDTGWKQVSPQFTYKYDTWYWVQLHFDSSANTYDIYVNDTYGRLVKRVNDATYVQTTYAPTDLYIDDWNSPAGDETPTVTGFVDEVRVSNYPGLGYFKSHTFTAPGYITSVTPYWNATIPEGTNLWVNISRDGGVTWNSSALYNGQKYTFPTEPRGKDLVYNITFTSGGDYTSIFYDIEIYYTYCKPPSITLTGESSGDKFGYSVSGGSDIGGDSIPDIIIGAPYNDGSAADGGAVYVFNGSASMPTSILASNADYINYSTYGGAHLGFSVSKVGDVNGDGFNDLIAGSPAYSGNSGKAELLSCRKPPEIVDYDLEDSTAMSRLNDRIDVNAEYHFAINITHPNGWNRVNYVRIHAWYDFGSEANQYNGTMGGNINMFLEYENTTGTGIFRLRWPTGGEVTLGTCSEAVINSTTHSLEFYFTPGYQFRYAPGDGTWNAGPGFNDINSWNFEINVTDSGGWYDSVKDEFGVYRFTSVSASGNPQATGYPGDTKVMSPSTTLIYSSNADFRLNATIDDLWNSGLTASIGALNVAINWTGHVPNDYVYFSGSGSPIWIFGSATTFESAPLDGTYQTIYVYWRIDIPVGTPPDTYSSPVNYTISQT